MLTKEAIIHSSLVVDGRTLDTVGGPVISGEVLAAGGVRLHAAGQGPGPARRGGQVPPGAAQDNLRVQAVQ